MILYYNIIVKYIRKEARRILAHNKATRKLNRYKQCLETGDDYADTSDEEKQKMISEKKQRQLELLEKARKKGNTRKSSVKSYKSTSSVTSAATKKNGYDLTKRMLKEKVRPTAVFVENDTMAVGAYKAIAEEGLVIPDDISIVGFNDQASAKYMVPSLTTVKLSTEYLASAAVDLLLENIDGSRPYKKKVIIPTKLKIRKSCKSI